MKTAYRVIHSARRTIAIQISPAGEVVVRAPMGMSGAAVERFVRSKTAWIEKHTVRQAPAEPPFTDAEIRELARQAKASLPERAAYFAPLVGVTYGNITIRNQRTRWGSCSSQGNLNFNCLLMLSPPEVLDYVIVHELAHRKQMNHSAAFWEEVAAVLPDYRKQVKWLKEQGPQLLARMRSGTED